MANKTSGLYLKPTIEQLQDKSGKTYYGISTDGDAVEDAGTTYFEIATIGATTGTAKYNCTADLIVDVSEDTGMVTALKDGEVFVKFEANEAITSGYPESPVDLHKDTTSDGKKTFNLEFDLTGTTPVSIKAQSYFVNSSSEDRTLGLAGKTLNAKITIDNLSCTVTD